MLTLELQEQTQRALEQRAARHGHTVEAEVRSIVEDALGPVAAKKGLGAELREIVERYGGYDLETTRNNAPLEPATFE